MFKGKGVGLSRLDQNALRNYDIKVREESKKQTNLKASEFVTLILHPEWQAATLGVRC